MCCAAAVPATAAAQGAKDVAAARQAFKEGEEAEGRGDLAIAVTKFQQALAIKATPQLYLRIGAVQEKLGRLVDALGSYEHGLEKASNLPAVAKVAREQIDALRPRVPTVTVIMAKRPADMVVTLDGAPVDPALIGKEIPVDPGAHRLHAQAPGSLPRDQAFTTSERGRARVELELQASAEVGPPPATPPPDASPSKVPGGVLTGAGGAVLVVGVALLATSFAKDSAINSECHGAARTMCPASQKSSILSEVSTVNALRFSGIGAAVVGAGAIGAGIFLLVRRPAPASGDVRVVPAVGAGTGGVVVLGSF